jgi:hypothetical protein
MENISPADLLFLTLSVVAAPIGAVWLIRERKSQKSKTARLARE